MWYLKCFSRWNIDIDNIEVINEGKPSAGHQVQDPENRTTFMLGGSCTLVCDDVDWRAAEEIIVILTSTVERAQALLEALPFTR